MNEIFRLSMIVSVYFLQCYDFLCVCFCSIGDTSRIGFSFFWGMFELKAIPLWYRLLELMTEQIGYEVLI